MNAFIRLVENEFRLQIFELRQYWFETVLSMLAMTAIFVGLFVGLRFFVVEAVADKASTLDSLLFGYIIWIFASGAYSSANSSINDDAQKGILDQLFLCPEGFRQLMVARAVSGLGLLLVTMLILSYLAMFLTGNWVDINFPMLFIVLLLGAPSLFGLGFAVAGLTLIFKRVGTLGALLTVALIGVVALDGLPVSAVSTLPFTPTVTLAKYAVLQASPITFFDVAVAAINSLAYYFIGLVVFRRCEYYAKKMNLIGVY